MKQLVIKTTDGEMHIIQVSSLKGIESVEDFHRKLYENNSVLELCYKDGTRIYIIKSHIISITAK